MTVTATNRKNSFPTNGVTVDFPFTFSVNTEGQVYSLTRATDGTETPYTNFTVALNPTTEGGTLTTGDALNDVTLVVYRDTALSQQTDYVPGGRFPAESHEAALDKLTQISQEQQEEIDRSLKSSISDVAPPTLEEYDASVNQRDADTLAAANDYTNKQVFEAGTITPDSLGGLTNYQAASVADRQAGVTIGGETVELNNNQVWYGRDTDASINAYTPAIGELWLNTTDNTIHMGDGVTPGGVKFVNVNLISTNLPYATTSSSGVVEIATQAEVDAGFDGQRMVSPLTLKNKIPFQSASVKNPGKVANVVYTNTTGKPIQVNIHVISLGSAGQPGGQFKIGGFTAINFGNFASDTGLTVCSIVPPNKSYELATTGTDWTLFWWAELEG